MGSLHLDMQVAGTAGVEARDDGVQVEGTIGVGELVPPVVVADAVVVSGIIGLPKVDQGTRDGATVTGRPGTTKSVRCGEFALK